MMKTEANLAMQWHSLKGECHRNEKPQAALPCTAKPHQESEDYSWSKCSQSSDDALLSDIISSQHSSASRISCTKVHRRPEVCSVQRLFEPLHAS